jgi:tetratricopeptide (TPR) repeat protein
MSKKADQANRTLKQEKEANRFKHYLTQISDHWMLFIPVFIAVILYLPAIQYDLVWDDTIFLRDLPNYRDPELWLPALFQPFVLSPNYFRPLPLLTFAIELQLGGQTWLFHLSNILLHGANTFLISLLALKLVSSSSNGSPNAWRRFAPAIVAGTLYGLHPVLIEGVTFISSRFDLLMTFFLLLALWADHQMRGRPNRPLIVGLFFLLAALSKEMAVSFALALPFWHLAAMKSDRSIRKLIREDRNWEVYLAAIISGLTYLGIRFLSLGYLMKVNPESMIPAGNLIQRVLLSAKSIAVYVGLTIWPFGNQAPIHFSDLPVPTNQIIGWITLITVVLILVVLVSWVRKRPNSGWLLVAAFVSLFPVVNIFPLELGGGAFIAERFLIFPLALLAFCMAVVLSRLLNHSADDNTIMARLPDGAVSVWLLACIVTIQLTLPNWRNDLSLWEWGAQKSPNSDMPYTNLSLEYVGMGQYELAGQLALHAIDLSENNADAWNNLGLSYFHQGEFEEAEAAFQAATELQPNNALFWSNLAGALREQDKLAEAEVILVDKALQLNPLLPSGHLNLGIVYIRADRPDLALFHLDQAIRLLPSGQKDQVMDILSLIQEPEPWLKLGQAMLLNGDEDRAADAFAMARDLGALPADVAIGVSAAFIDLERLDEAEEILNEALQVSPDDARLYNNLGIVARERGDLDEARGYFEQAVELAPSWELPQENLQELGLQE